VRHFTKPRRSFRNIQPTMFHLVHFFSENWFDAVQTGGIFAGLIFTAVSLRDTQQAQRITNLFTLTQYQRELYGELFNRPALRRIFSDDVDLANHPVTADERLFLTMVILHLNLAVEAIKGNAIEPLEGLDRDVAELFRKPIPQVVWKEICSVQNHTLRDLIDRITGSRE